MASSSGHSGVQNEFLEGIKSELPVVLGVIPFGMIYGVLALSAGLPPLLAQAMSAIVFAGSTLSSIHIGSGEADVFIAPILKLPPKYAGIKCLGFIRLGKIQLNVIDGVVFGGHERNLSRKGRLGNRMDGQPALDLRLEDSPTDIDIITDHPRRTIG